MHRIHSKQKGSFVKHSLEGDLAICADAGNKNVIIVLILKDFFNQK